MTVDEVGGRSSGQVIQRRHTLIVIQDVRIGHAKLLHELLRGGKIVYGIDAQDHQILACRLLSRVKALHARSLSNTSRTLRVPEIEHDGSAAIAAQAHFFAIQGSEGKVGSRVSD